MILNLSKLEVYRAGSVLPLKQISNTGERFVPMLIFSTRIDRSWFYITQPSRKTSGAIFAPTPTLFLLLNFALSCFLTLYFFSTDLQITSFNFPLFFVRFFFN